LENKTAYFAAGLTGRQYTYQTISAQSEETEGKLAK